MTTSNRNRPLETSQWQQGSTNTGTSNAASGPALSFADLHFTRKRPEKTPPK